MRADGSIRDSNRTSLDQKLRALEGSPYPAYRTLRGRHHLEGCDLELLTIQPDPFAPPSRIRLSVPIDAVGLAGHDLATEDTRLASRDFFARIIEKWLGRHPAVGSVVRCDPASQQILDRSMVRLAHEGIEVLLFAHLPARGRRIEGERAAAAVAQGIPRLVRETLQRGSWDRAALDRHIASVEDHRALTGILAERGWVAFIADGSRLARRSGEEDVPLEEGNVPCVSPSGFAAEVSLPHAGSIRGLAIPRGITLLCGGGFHGKSTLLRAIAVGIYPHIPGDGRERIATEPTAMGIRAEDGRSIMSVDLSPFIANLPNGGDAASFETANASGSTSQAAGIIEAMGTGCKCLLIDEDTSATNFLLRDRWMARLLRPDQEPIVPLLSRLPEIHERFGVSTILVVGGSGEAFRVADRVIIMDAYRPIDGTARVAEIRSEMGNGSPAPPAEWSRPERDLDLRPLRARHPRIRALTARRILAGRSEIDLSASGALVHPSQGRTLAAILEGWIAGTNGTVSLPGDAQDAARRIAREGLGSFPGPPTRGDLCEVRAQEIAMMMHRLRVVADVQGETPLDDDRSQAVGTDRAGRA